MGFMPFGKKTKLSNTIKKHQRQKIYIGNVTSEWNELKENLEELSCRVSSRLIKRYI